MNTARMKNFLTVSGIIFFILLAELGSNGEENLCSWAIRGWTCDTNQFQCSNGKCIFRSSYCNGANDCEDGSDEMYCNVFFLDSCKKLAFVKCESVHKCIPEVWLCDGFQDCPHGDDERNCGRVKLYKEKALNGINSLEKAAIWLHNRKSHTTTEKWGSQVDKVAVGLFFGDQSFISTEGNETAREVAYEVSIQLLYRLSNMKLQDIPSTDLASFLNALVVSCLDPRKFHGNDVVQELRARVDKQNYTNPYVLLSLCNAGDTITDNDKLKLIDTFWSKSRPLWTDMQAFVVMALACANKQQGNEVDSETIKELTLELMQRQSRNGSVENLQSTALVLQALIATDTKKDPDNFDDVKAIEEILRNQEIDGSFGDLTNTYFVLPVLTCKSLMDINSDHCQFGRTDEISALDNLANRSGPKIRVQYSLWIGSDKDMERNLVLRVPLNMSLYGVMEIAAEVDSKYRFEYTVKNRKPYINAISGIRDNPEKGKFWFLYTVQDGQSSPSKDSPSEVVPKDSEHYVMWYRSGSWID